LNPQLRTQLESLHRELGRTPAVDDATRKLLVTLLGDITRLLQRSTRSEAEHESLTERLDALAVQFEAEHPALGTAIRSLVDALGKAGI
jgi:uncharacterized protein DUF4404